MKKTEDQLGEAQLESFEQQQLEVARLKAQLEADRKELEREREHFEESKRKQEWRTVGLPTWIMALTAIGALCISIFSLGRSTQANESSGTVLEIVDNTIIGRSADPSSTTEGEVWLAQLASYRPSECGLAREAVMRLDGEFGGETSLWSTASGTWLVVGIAQETEEAAEAVVSLAESRNAEFPLDTLRWLKVQRAPEQRLSWSRVETCDEV